MWSKFTSALKPHVQAPKQDNPQGQVLSKVIEQHPNLSMFHPNESGVVGPQPDPQGSSSVHSKKNMRKRLSKPPVKDDSESQRSLSLFPSFARKVKGALDPNYNNGSQLSLNLTSAEAMAQRDVPRRLSFDMLRPNPESSRPHQDTVRSTMSRSRQSFDFLRQDPAMPESSTKVTNEDPHSDFHSPNSLNRYDSKRSILRDPNTPGTGQNVHFFPKDNFKVITPDQSMEPEDKPQPPLPRGESPFFDNLTKISPPNFNSFPVRSSPSKSRPSVIEIFSPLNSPENSVSKPSDAFYSFSSHTGGIDDNSNLFDLSQQLDIPRFPPSGLDFDVNAPILDSPSMEISLDDIDAGGNANGFLNRMTSTPHRVDKGKRKEIENPVVKKIEVPAPPHIDETIFHAKEHSPKFAAPLQRSQSFSFGQTLFFSMANSGEDSNSKSAATDIEAAYPSSDLKPDSVHSSSTAQSPPPPPPKTRGRAMSDSMFQNMLRTAPKSVGPEADINDDSSQGLVVVYSGGPSEPDPFNANANTYYTPQTMIPSTPPIGTLRHNRKTSKEENIIISLQTQLALRTELCAQYETDLKARDELVEILGAKLSDFEQDEARKKNALRSWKKKVQELERACRMLEESVEDSRQESMDRSALDEASGEALRMLHRQIANLEREKNDWAKREEILRQKVETLEGLVHERSEDIITLKENLRTRDESERELKEGIREAKEQIEMMGNVSVGVVDEEELRKILMEKEMKNVEETERFRTVEFGLRQEIEEMKTKYEGFDVEKASWQERVEGLTQQLATRDEEYATLKAELEVQWEHTEKATDAIDKLEQEKDDLVAERDAFKADVDEMELRMASMEEEWNENDNKRNELESKVQEVWNIKNSLEKDREQLEEALHEERKRNEDLGRTMEDCNSRISALEQELRFANDNDSRLKDNVEQRDKEIEQHTQRIREREAELEQLRESMSTLKREYSHVVSQQSRALQDAAGQQDQTKVHMEELVQAKAEVDVELKTSKERVTVLKEEVERLRKQIYSLQQESADKEVKIVQLGKQHGQDKEDLTGLNIALDSKQQELELLKRKVGVRGTAGSTPAHPSKNHRRDSTVFTTTPLSSAISTGSEAIHLPRQNSAEKSTSKVTALGKSTRVNGTASSTTSSLTKSGVRSEGSMGPPPAKPRPSILSGTPTPMAQISSISRSSSAKNAVPVSTPVSHRRGSTSNSDQGSSGSKLKSSRAGIMSPTPSDKENVETPSSADRRRSLIPTLAG